MTSKYVGPFEASHMGALSNLMQKNVHTKFYKKRGRREAVNAHIYVTSLKLQEI